MSKKRFSILLGGCPYLWQFRGCVLVDVTESPTQSIGEWIRTDEYTVGRRLWLGHLAGLEHVLEGPSWCPTEVAGLPQTEPAH